MNSLEEDYTVKEKLMINKHCKCGWCNIDTKRIYQLKDGRFLCLACASKHFECVNTKMQKHIQEIQSGLKKKKEKIQRLIEATCEHKNQYNTGYVTGNGEGTIKEIWNCPDCHKRLYMSSTHLQRKVELLDHKIKSYMLKGTDNPCGCGSNVFHLESDDNHVYGVCNACKSDIYEYTDYFNFKEWKIKDSD